MKKVTTVNKYEIELKKFEINDKINNLMKSRSQLLGQLKTITAQMVQGEKQREGLIKCLDENEKEIELLKKELE